MKGELWLIGSDIAHSPSPVMHNAALAALGLVPNYRLYPCDEGSVDRVWDEAEARCRGINVTLPYKTKAAARYAAQMDECARRVGAVNTVLFEKGRAISAINTDVDGLLYAWRRGALHIEGKRAVVFGAGGAARAAVYALAQAKAGGVSILARRGDAAEALRHLAAEEGLPADCGEGPGGELLIIAAPEVPHLEQLLDDSLVGTGIVHDLRYGPKTYPMRNQSLKKGHLYLDGRSMLLGQALRACSAFSGRALTREAESAMSQALAKFVQ